MVVRLRYAARLRRRAWSGRATRTPASPVRTCSSSPTGWAGTPAARWPAPPRSPACAGHAPAERRRRPDRHRAVPRVAAAGERLRALVRDRPELEGMGTTLTLLAAQRRDASRSPRSATRAAYLLRDGVLERVTRDQTFVQSLIDQGRISDEEAQEPPAAQPAAAGAGRSRRGRARGRAADARSPATATCCAATGSRCVVSEPTIRDVLQDGTPAEAAERLVDLALRAGAPDNVTCLVADVVDGGGRASRSRGPVVVGAAAATEQAHAVAAIPDDVGADDHDRGRDDDQGDDAPAGDDD